MLTNLNQNKLTQSVLHSKSFCCGLGLIFVTYDIAQSSVSALLEST